MTTLLAHLLVMLAVRVDDRLPLSPTQAEIKHPLSFNRKIINLFPIKQAISIHCWGIGMTTEKVAREGIGKEKGEGILLLNMRRIGMGEFRSMDLLVVG